AADGAACPLHASFLRFRWFADELVPRFLHQERRVERDVFPRPATTLFDVSFCHRERLDSGCCLSCKVQKYKTTCRTGTAPHQAATGASLFQRKRYPTPLTVSIQEA